jgi:hypothetical protein
VAAAAISMEAGATSRVATLRVAASPEGPFLKEDSIATSACLVGYLVTASPTVTHTPTATTIAIDARGPMGEADVGLTHQADAATDWLTFARRVSLDVVRIDCQR